MSKVKLLYIITKCSKSGPINVLNSIIDNLDRGLFEIYLISTSEEDSCRSMLEDFTRKVDHYQYIRLSPKDAALGNIKKLEAAITQINPDVIHSTGVVTDLAVSRICPDKHMLIVHSNVMVDNVYLCGKLKGTMLAFLNLFLFRRAKCAVACSKSLSDIYKKYGLNLPYIRNGVSVSQLHDIDKSELRKQLGLPVDKTIYIYTASFNQRKNHSFLVKAFSQNGNQDAVLLLLGDGETFEKNKKIASSNNVIFTGRKSNVIPYLNASDYFISSSLQEGMPMAVLEAMACGLPVLLSDIPQHEEIFELNHDVGCIFQNNSDRNLNDQIIALTEKNYDKMSHEAYDTVEKYFNAKVMGKQYQKLYIELAHKFR